MGNELKLTPKQNAVINCLQKGGILITDSSVKGAIVTRSKEIYFRINNGIFWRLVDMELIYQGIWERDNFNYVLTRKGKEIKTKDITIKP